MGHTLCLVPPKDPGRINFRISKSEMPWWEPFVLKVYDRQRGFASTTRIIKELMGLVEPKLLEPHEIEEFRKTWLRRVKPANKPKLAR